MNADTLHLPVTLFLPAIGVDQGLSDLNSCLVSSGDLVPFKYSGHNGH
jgi:hypothetical protein